MRIKKKLKQEHNRTSKIRKEKTTKSKGEEKRKERVKIREKITPSEAMAPQIQTRKSIKETQQYCSILKV